MSMGMDFSADYSMVLAHPCGARGGQGGTLVFGVNVVVIGGGCIGLACATTLAQRGQRVVLLERGLPGAANSTRTGGGIRKQFGTALNVRLSQLSADVWDNFAEVFGVDPDFRRIGYLFLARSNEQAAALRRNVTMQVGIGVASEYLDGNEIEQRWPALAGRGFAAASFCAEDGWANHHRIVHGLTRGAIAAGVDLLIGREVFALKMLSGRVVGVETSAGPIAADSVLVATGPWTDDLLGPLGVAPPVVARRHELLIVEPSMPLPRGLPWLVGMEDEVHVRSDVAGRALVGGFLGEDRAVDPDDYDERANATWARTVLQTVERVFGVVDAGARIAQGWAGLYPSTPDHHPIIDRIVDGLYVALGFSGTGLMHAPAAGVLAAELIVDGAIRSVDAEIVSLRRFGNSGSTVETTGF
jgi:sarcosine oxidase subunit beta